jgi:hypothetical protein
MPFCPGMGVVQRSDMELKNGNASCGRPGASQRQKQMEPRMVFEPVASGLAKSAGWFARS